MLQGHNSQNQAVGTEADFKLEKGREEDALMEMETETRLSARRNSRRGELSDWIACRTGQKITRVQAHAQPGEGGAWAGLGLGGDAGVGKLHPGKRRWEQLSIARVSLDGSASAPSPKLLSPPMVFPSRTFAATRRTAVRSNLFTRPVNSSVRCDRGASKLLGSKLGLGGGAPSGSSLSQVPPQEVQVLPEATRARSKVPQMAGKPQPRMSKGRSTRGSV